VVGLANGWVREFAGERGSAIVRRFPDEAEPAQYVAYRTDGNLRQA
jgi:hypothetical protein